MKFSICKLIALTITTALCFSTVVSQEGKCKVLAMNGGGDHGAYEIGVLKSLVKNLAPEERNWKVVTGISIGSFNGVQLSLFKEGEEVQAVEYLESIWRSFESYEDIFKNWVPSELFAPVYAMLNKNSFYDNTPLRELITKSLSDKKIEREFITGVTKLRNGIYEPIHTDKLSREELINTLIASAAVPGFFPPVELNGEIYVDGGIYKGAELVQGINACKEKGYKDEDIIVDHVQCFHNKLEEKDPSTLKPHEIFQRMSDIQTQALPANEANFMKNAFPKVNFRFSVAPSEKIGVGDIPLLFDKTETDRMISLGEKDGDEAVYHYFRKPATKNLRN